MELLNDTQAAIHLGITKELLYSYVRNPAKKQLGHQRRLRTVEKEGRNYFERGELDEFDQYLNEPWSEPGEKRPEIPSFIKDYLRTEIGGKCPITGEGYPLEYAHIEDYSISRNHHHHNIIRVHQSLHTKADNNVVPKIRLREAKDSLIEALRQQLRQERGQYKTSCRPPIPHSLFVGRFEKLLELIAVMEVERMVVIEGLGGIGKTQLLLNALENVRYHNPVIWIDCELMSTFNDLTILLTNAVSKITGGHVAGSLVDALAEIRVTIILDSLEVFLIPRRDEIEDFIHAVMTQCPEVQILITSQISLSIFDEAKMVVELGGLDRVSSEILLEELIPQNLTLSTSERSWILSFCDGHPLSLKLSASLISFFRSGEKAISRITSIGGLKAPMRRGHNKSNALEVCLNTVFASLSTEQKDLLQHVKYFPAGCKVLWTNAHFSSKDFDHDVATLQQFYFIEVVSDFLDFERLMNTGPVRKFLFDKTGIKGSESRIKEELDVYSGIMMEALIVDHHYVESQKYGSAEYGIMRLETELPNILEAFRLSRFRLENNRSSLSKNKISKYLGIVGGIASSLGKFFFTRGFFKQGISVAKAGIDVNIEQGLIEEAANQYMYLIQLQARTFNVEGMEESVNELFDLANESGDQHALMLANLSKGRLIFEKQDYLGALSYYEKAKVIIEGRIRDSSHDSNEEEDVGDDTIYFTQVHLKGNYALILADIAKVFEFSDMYADAIPQYEKSIEIQKEIKDTNIGNTVHHLANCYRGIGKIDDGIKLYFEAVESFCQIGQWDFVGNSLSELGIIVIENPKVAKHPLVSRTIIMGALDDLANQIESVIAQLQGRGDEEDWTIWIPRILIGKAIKIMMLVGFSKHRELLSKWVLKLIEDASFSMERPSFFGAILNGIHSIGGVDHWKELDDRDSKKVIDIILQSCVIMNGGPDLDSPTRIFYWLENWMKFHQIDPNANAQELWKSAWESMEQ